VVFADRDEAGWLLARELSHLRGSDVVVLGLPRGGVPVAYEVARALDAPLDVFVVGALLVPFRPEAAFGAVGEGGTRIVDEAAIGQLGLSSEEVAAIVAHETAVVERRARRWRWARPLADLDGRIALIVDDGLRTGLTARAACQVARARGAARVVIAVPVAPPAWETALCSDADELHSLLTPKWFFAIHQFYEELPVVSDEEIVARLEAASHRLPPSPRPKQDLGKRAVA
jgi:putative phosphoribosyl transferase